MHRNWRYALFAFGYVTALPHTLVGLALAAIYGGHRFAWRDGVLECTAKRRADGTSRIWFKPMAQTHGWLIIYADEYQRSRPELRVHEFAHVWQGMMLGPIYIVVYGGHFGVRYALGLEWPSQKPGMPDWWPAYRGIVFERQAFAIGKRYRAELPVARVVRWGHR